MTSRILAALGAAAVATSLAVAVPAAPAAAAPAWQTVLTLSGAKEQVCKVAAADDTWRVRVRVDAGGATRATFGRVDVVRPTGALGGTWSSGRVAPGTVSAAGALTLPRNTSYRLRLRLENALAGRGADVAIGSVRAC